jgi:hypothetical protein
VRHRLSHIRITRAIIRELQCENRWIITCFETRGSPRFLLGLWVEKPWWRSLRIELSPEEGKYVLNRPYSDVLLHRTCRSSAQSQIRILGNSNRTESVSILTSCSRSLQAEIFGSLGVSKISLPNVKINRLGQRLGWCSLTN